MSVPRPSVLRAPPVVAALAAGLLIVAAVVVVVVVTVVVATPVPAAADAAGPTDYQTTIESIEPETQGIELSVIGGDSFIRLEAEPGIEVEVVGYRGEPYLRFDADGSVFENQLSPTRWVNEDRFAAVEVPAEATPSAEPDWQLVASDGSYAWHDHRSHWMNTARPPGRSAGDVILEAVIPLVVDGEPVSVEVRSVWVESPSPLPWLVGGAVAIALVIGAVRIGGRTVGPAGVVAAVAAAGLALGLVAYRSVPAETEPSTLLWFLPALAVGFALAALLLGRRWSASPERRPIVTLVVAFGALELALWGWIRREALQRALIPSDAPPWLDRTGIALALVTGAACLVLVIIEAAQPQPEP